MLHVCLEKKGLVKNIPPDVKRIQTLKITSQKLNVLVQFGAKVIYMSAEKLEQLQYNRLALKLLSRLTSSKSAVDVKFKVLVSLQEFRQMNKVKEGLARDLEAKSREERIKEYVAVPKIQPIHICLACPPDTAIGYSTKNEQYRVSLSGKSLLKMQSENLGPVNYYVGIDVGTSSVRAALVDQIGTVVAYAEHPIQIWAPQPDYYEQSSDDIWAACCIVTKKITQGINISQIRGLGFDATCSLVVLDSHFHPLAVNSEGEHKRNIIMWMDHRAANQATRINETQHNVLSFVGGVMSVEMQPPKLLWMKENLRESCWEKAGHFFDLPDFLSWKATGATARSLCTLVCKWTYSSETGWDDCFWKSIGLEDLMANKYSKIGNEVLPPGSPVGNGLTAEAAEDLGLSKGIAVAASLIDAHAGGLGIL
ncbi:FGGY carbohydrate kinase domain-containing protein-like [Protobothrops mucrosquamatus]|uniref:FGGY carbohydrate kinase domain-containing protein-like n=1 Tax=Protobothrops mucrosquamatus TaxID=103944 RepID=UPI0010FB81D4|nr:FGGY carbohydrate kinase domain-containing protein-like [Protobothrops mucrosquamatus]